MTNSNNTTKTVSSIAIDLFHQLGPWHSKSVYQRALKEAILRQGLRTLVAPRVALRDEWGTTLTVYYPDLVVKDDNKAILVSVALDGEPIEDAIRQVRAWLSAWRGPAMGMLLRFGEQRLTWKVIHRFGNQRGGRSHG